MSMEKSNEENILINPVKDRRDGDIPENGLLLVNPSEAARCLGELHQSGGDFRYLFNSRLVVAGKLPFFAAGPAIGSPMAAMTMEKLIALGAKRIILFGWCGALSPELKVGDILVPDRAESGEGTSRYYSPQEPLRPGEYLCEQLRTSLDSEGMSVHRGCVWSTDAVYRENRFQLYGLREERGVVAVDMEFSALCSVARFRKIQFGAVLTVSDELWGKTWRPGFSAERFHQQKNKALAILVKKIATFNSD
ncbi:MAG: nucleoside phosphorylase [Desulforhopalus sp.]